MGCISSKLAAAGVRQERNLLYGGGALDGDCRNHVVSLTSSTYGVLKLDRDDDVGGEEACRRSPPLVFTRFQKKVFAEEPEVINAWQLMEDLDDDIPMYSPVKKKKPGKPDHAALSSPEETGLSDDTILSPPGKQKLAGKENLRRTEPERSPGVNPLRVLKPFSSSDNMQRGSTVAAPVSAVRFKSTTPANLKIQVSGRDSDFSGSRRSLRSPPLFDLDLVASFEKEHCEEGEQIKKMVSAAPPRNPKARAAAALLESLPKKCPPGGESAAVLYTTTLRGIRKTFEDCNAVRAAVESHDVGIVERDISMDSGFREELRVLMGRREVRVPVLFVKGRVVDGAEEVLKLEEEGRLGVLLSGMPAAASAWCDGCRGVRFLMCSGCSGSRKVLNEAENRSVRCGECNENGLIRCPICR